jgi:site-specific DNA-cytosine methylase
MPCRVTSGRYTRCLFLALHRCLRCDGAVLEYFPSVLPLCQQLLLPQPTMIRIQASAMSALEEESLPPDECDPLHEDLMHADGRSSCGEPPSEDCSCEQEALPDEVVDDLEVAQKHQPTDSEESDVEEHIAALPPSPHMQMADLDWNGAWSHFQNTMKSAGLKGLGKLAARSLRIGTDCSGIDAAVTALQSARAAGVPIMFTHVSACDIDEHARQWLMQVHKPSVLFCNMLDRDWKNHGQSYDCITQQLKPFPPLDVLVTGFPCTPFSTLHGGSAGFDEPAAKPFFQTLTTIMNVRPLITVLENVMGILHKKYKPQLTAELEKLARAGLSYVIIPGLSPHQFGSPVLRSRVYIVVWRAADMASNFGCRVQELLHKLRRPVEGGSFLQILKARAGAAMAPASAELSSCSCSWERDCHLPRAQFLFKDASLPWFLSWKLLHTSTDVF